MNAENMMDIIGEARGDYIQSALETRTQKKRHKSLSHITKLAFAAAMIFALAVTAYASDFAGIKSLRDGDYCKMYDSYQKLDTAEKKAGFEMDAKETFENGYAFESMKVESTDAYDEHDEKRLTYMEISVYYKNDVGHRLSLYASPEMEAIPHSSLPATETRQIGDITAEYRESIYRFLPVEKENNLTEEEKLWEEQPGHFISYGAEEAVETKITTLAWVKDGIHYFFMDEGFESSDTLFAMASELITK